MTNQEWLAAQIKKLPPEEVYDTLYNIVINIGSRYNTSRGGVADWLTKDAIEVAPLIKRKKNRMNDDTIYRQSAIDTALRAISDLQGKDSLRDEYIVSEMEEIPSAERHGRWIKKYRGNYLCSECGAWFRTTDEYGNIIDGEMTANYCESCGAKMDEECENESR